MSEDLGQRLAQVLKDHAVEVLHDNGAVWCACYSREWSIEEHRAHVITHIAMALQVTTEEQHGIAWYSNGQGAFEEGLSDIEKHDASYIEAKGSRAYGDKIYRRTVIKIPDIVGEWEEVSE